MAMVQSIGGACDRVMTALVAGLEIEFGRGVGEALAQRFLDAEQSDFLWDARVLERWLGSYEGLDDDDDQLNRVAIFGRLDGLWFAGVSIVDGDGNAQGLIARRSFEHEEEALEAYAMMR